MCRDNIMPNSSLENLYRKSSVFCIPYSFHIVNFSLANYYFFGVKLRAAIFLTGCVPGAPIKLLSNVLQIEKVLVCKYFSFVCRIVKRIIVIEKVVNISRFCLCFPQLCQVFELLYESDSKTFSAEYSLALYKPLWLVVVLWCGYCLLLFGYFLLFHW